MFQGADVFNQPLNQWNVSNVSNMIDLFYSATQFSQNLSNWCVPNITSKPLNTGFSTYWDTNAGFENNNALQPSWGTCPSQATLTLTSSDSDNTITSNCHPYGYILQNMAASPLISMAGLD